MNCEIADVVETISASNVATPVAGVVVKAEPDRLPIFIDDGTGFHEVEDPKRQTETGALGTWSIKLPKPSEQDPESSKWIITIDDKISWIGVPPNVDGPVTLHDLKDIYGWKLIRRPPTTYIQAVAGPKGDGSLAADEFTVSDDQPLTRPLYTPTEDGAYKITVSVSAWRESDNVAKGWEYKGTVKLKGGVLAIVGGSFQPVPDVPDQDDDAAEWTIGLAPSGGTLRLTFTAPGNVDTITINAGVFQ